MSDTCIAISSPPLIDHGEISPGIRKQIDAISSAVVEDPWYEEPGRLSRMIVWEEHGNNDTDLHRLGTEIGKTYLGTEPQVGSSAAIGVITDAVLFSRYTHIKNAAANWHQDFVITEHGFYFAPDNLVRLILPMQVGPLCVVGNVFVFNAVKIEPTEKPQEQDKEGALAAGSVVIGADGVLIKSIDMPIGGTVHELSADRVYGVPATSVHKTNPTFTDGRPFFQIDFKATS